MNPMPRSQPTKGSHGITRTVPTCMTPRAATLKRATTPSNQMVLISRTRPHSFPPPQHPRNLTPPKRALLLTLVRQYHCQRTATLRLRLPPRICHQLCLIRLAALHRLYRKTPGSAKLRNLPPVEPSPV